MTRPNGHLATLVRKARQRADLGGILVGEIEVYCQNTACPVRTVTVFVKEFGAKTPSALTCPACQKPLKVHHVETLAERERRQRARSRGSVNAQMYGRDHQEEPGRPALIPLSAFLDERLPPTPPGWWDAAQGGGR